MNLPELMQIYLSFTDVITRDDIDRMLAAEGRRLSVPKVKGGKPENVVVERSPEQARYIGEPIKDADGNDTDQYPRGSLIWRAENLPKTVEKGGDNMLKIMSDARKAALDMRMIDPNAPDPEGSKLNVAARRIVDIYRKWDADKGAQLVFLDLSTPKAARGAEAARIRGLIAAAEEGDESAQAELDKLSPDDLLALDGEFSAYDDLKEKLVRLGIPADEIAFIHDAKTDGQKAELFGKVRSGRVRVLMGSTSKMGAGTNVQDRLVALHHIDAPWRPSDLEQREGRIVRQGNKLYERDPEGFEVEVIRYATKGTLDARMWQTIEGKAIFIGQVRKGATGQREIEDIGGEAANAAEMKAAASGNPLVLEEMSLRQRVKRLEGERYAHDSGQFRIRDMIRATERRIEANEQRAAAMREDVKRKTPDKFKMTVRGETFEKRKDAGLAILKAAMEMQARGQDSIEVGTYGDFRIVIDLLAKDRFAPTVVGEGEYQPEDFSLGADPQGLTIRITNAVQGLGEAIKRIEKAIAEDRASLPKLRAQVAEWPKAAELEETKARHREVIAQLRPKKKEDGAAAASGAKPSIAGSGSDEIESAFGDTRSLAEHLMNDDLGGFVRALMDAGRVVLHDDIAELAARHGAPREATVRGLTVDGVIHLSAKGLTAETAMPTLLHEVFHVGVEPLIGSKRWHNLLDRVGTILANQEAKAPGERSLFWRDAIAHIDEIGTPAEHRAEELAAYAIDYREAAPAGLGAILDNIVGAVKAWVLKTFGTQVGAVTPGQLRALARAALRDGWQVVPDGDPGGRSIRESKLMRETIRSIVEVAWREKSGPVSHLKAKLFRAPNWLVRLAKRNGLKIVGYQHSIDGSAVKHIHDRHSSQKKEEKHNQIAVTPRDIELIPEVVTFPDAIIFGTVTKTGLPGIGYIKKINASSTLYVEEARSGQRELAATSMRKHPATMDARDIAVTLTSNVRNDSRANPILVENPRSANPIVTPIADIEKEKREKEKREKEGGARFNIAPRQPITGAAEPEPGRVRELLSNALTQAMGGKYGLLAAAPLRPMLEELGKELPSATRFLKVKQAMDTLRNEWHAKVDEIAQRWLKYRVRDQAENGRLMDIMHESTLAQVDPSKPFVPKAGPADWILYRKGDPESEKWQAAARRIAEDDRRRAAWKDLKARFDALSDEGRALYEVVRDTYRDLSDEFEATILANMQKALEIGVKRAEREHAAEMRRIRDEGLTGQEQIDAIEAADRRLQIAKTKNAWNKRARLTLMREQFETNRLNGPYFPLARFGNFYVTVRDSDGRVLSFSRFERVSKQQRFAREMRRDANVTVETGVLSSDNLRRQVDPTFVADVEAILEGSGVSPAVMDEVWQHFLRSMPDSSVRKNRIHRLGRAGFHTDALRAFASHLFHGAHQLARLKHGMDLREHLDTAREEAKQAKSPERAGLLVNEMEERFAYILSPEGSALAQALTSATFVYQLSMSPAAALVNVSQTVMMGLPILAAFDGSATGGMARAAAEIGKAVTDFTLGRGAVGRSKRLIADEINAVQRAYDLGVIDRSRAHDLAGVSESGVEYNPVRQKIMSILSWQFHQAERFNREVTFLAAYRMARKKGLDHDEAIDKASELTWKTHFDYQNTSRPRLMQKDVAKVLFVFRNYNVNMLFRLFRDTYRMINADNPAERKEALIQFGGITGMMALNAGIRGTWLFGIAMVLAGIFFPAGDDPEEELKKGLTEFLPGWAAGMVLDGVPGYATGTALSERIGMPDLWFRSPDQQLEGEDAYNYWLQQALGASPSPIQNAFRGYELVKEGNTYRGIEAVAPKFVKDLMRAYRYGTEGALTLKGDDIVPADQISAADIIKQAVGFTPAKIAEMYGRNRAMKNREQAITDERDRILADFARAYREDSATALETVEDRIDAFNAENPDYPITGKVLRQSLRGRLRAAERMDGGIDINPRLNERIRSEAARTIYQ